MPNYNTDGSAQRATNGVMDGGVLINMLPEDHTYAVQCLQYTYKLYRIE